MPQPQTLAAIDLGSNSFRLQIAQVVDDQIYPFDALKDTVRLAAGLRADDTLDEEAEERALACLRRFGERLRSLPPDRIRAVGTNTLRVARNADVFLRKAEAALGHPIEVIAGREEARLIFLGVSHGLPPSKTKRLVVDIGGGSTECIIGSALKPQRMESLFMGCVSYSRKFFPDGKITKAALKEAELAARNEVQTVAKEFRVGNWDEAYGSSGTARSLGDLLGLNDLAASGITLDGLNQLRELMLKAGQVDALNLAGLRPERRPVLPGGFAIMAGLFAELGIQQMALARGALREGVLWDLIGRQHHRDIRDVTVTHFKRRYGVELAQMERVLDYAQLIYRQISHPGIPSDHGVQLLGWAAKLHEIGRSIAHVGYHKHSAYILENADMPGFSRPEQLDLAHLVLSHRGGLAKLLPLLHTPEAWARTVALRLAVAICRGRYDLDAPDISVRQTDLRSFEMTVGASWLAEHLLVQTALSQEMEEWRQAGLSFRLLSRN